MNCITFFYFILIHDLLMCFLFCFVLYMTPDLHTAGEENNTLVLRLLPGVLFFYLCIKSGFVLIRNKDLIHFFIFLSIHCIYRVVCETFFLFFLLVIKTLS